MAVTKLMVCLANSRKHLGRCVAGIAIGRDGPQWIRPVSGRPGHEVSPAERQYGGGVEPQVLDVVSVSLVGARPFGIHRENWLLDPTIRWRRVGRIAWHELCDFEETPDMLWVDGYDTSTGLNDRVPVEQEPLVVDSITLIRVAEVTIEVSRAHPLSVKSSEVKARFRYAGSAYALKVTDPVYEERFRAKGLGKYRLGESFLTVSLTEAFRDNFFKVVAAVVERPVAESGGRR
ncbi:dual OB domain-containing protein [Saccharothrix sp. NRRL B-16348]|uniref:dual OB domain-containing protein n=1 Tax=Saccharothrix sp. NRRL B-16348 TaxID=1415542 RepID=UPI0006AEE585|nr:hypothetical protein [Saccharothrix sp. NRRL B-16348]